jgi:hypothetical protein
MKILSNELGGFYHAYLNHFAQPDTIVPNPLNPQSLNRYSYGLNNPSRYTDPSGHVATDASDGTGCGPDCLLNHLIYKDQELNRALGEYFRTHPNYDPAADPKLDPIGQSQVTSAKFWYDVDDGTASLSSMVAFAANAGVMSMAAGSRWAPTVNTDGDFYYTSTSCNAVQCTQGVDETVLFPTNKGQLQHIFRDATGHFAVDTAANRALLASTVQPGNFVGVDKYGNQIYAQQLSDGTEVWVEVRNGTIRNGGLNETPRYP